MKILIVDDDRSFRKGLAYELQDLGYNVTEAFDGKKAIQLINNFKFDFVICDLIMPETDGLEVYKKLRHIQPEAKFLLISAFVDSERARTAKRLLQENFIEKSVGYEQIFHKINKLLE